MEIGRLMSVEHQSTSGTNVKPYIMSDKSSNAQFSDVEITVGDGELGIPNLHLGFN